MRCSLECGALFKPLAKAPDSGRERALNCIICPPLHPLAVHCVPHLELACRASHRAPLERRGPVAPAGGARAHQSVRAVAPDSYGPQSIRLAHATRSAVPARSRPTSGGRRQRAIIFIDWLVCIRNSNANCCPKPDRLVCICTHKQRLDASVSSANRANMIIGSEPPTG